MLRFLFNLLLLLTFAWIGGLWWFAGQIPTEPTGNTVKTDAIVVLTGGTSRIDEGVRLIGAEQADELLISGINERTTLEEVLALVRPIPLNGAEEKITPGYRSGNTAGNAAETATWMNVHEYKSLRLVTSNYHMPRSLLEFSAVMPNITIIPHPVFSDTVDVERWWKTTGTRNLIMSEYNKYLVTRVRIWAEGV